MFIPCTSFSLASILRKQFLRHSNFCTLLEKWGGFLPCKYITETISSTFKLLHPSRKVGGNKGTTKTSGGMTPLALPTPATGQTNNTLLFVSTLWVFYPGDFSEGQMASLPSSEKRNAVTFT